MEKKAERARDATKVEKMKAVKARRAIKVKARAASKAKKVKAVRALRAIMVEKKAAKARDTI